MPRSGKQEFHKYPVDLQDAVTLAFRNPFTMYCVAKNLPPRGTPGAMRTVRTWHEKANAMMGGIVKFGAPVAGVHLAAAKREFHFHEVNAPTGWELWVIYKPGGRIPTETLANELLESLKKIGTGG